VSAAARGDESERAKTALVGSPEASRISTTKHRSPPPTSCATVSTASSASSAIKGPKRDVYLVPRHERSTFSIWSRSLGSIANAMLSATLRASVNARE
jgi:hypothetical protein